MEPVRILYGSLYGTINVHPHELRPHQQIANRRRAVCVAAVWLETNMCLEFPRRGCRPPSPPTPGNPIWGHPGAAGSGPPTFDLSGNSRRPRVRQAQTLCDSSRHDLRAVVQRPPKLKHTGRRIRPEPGTARPPFFMLYLCKGFPLATDPAERGRPH